MPCGLNSAIYFAEMDASGDAAYGTGYCDGQCARTPNLDHWVIPQCVMQDREEGCQLQVGRLSLRIDAFRVRLVCKHGAHHEASGSPRQLHDFLHSLQEDHGDQPKALHHVRAEEEGNNRQE